MPDSGIIFSYTGIVDLKKTDQLLAKLKKTDDFQRLQKTTGRRVYAIMVECLENIARHSSDSLSGTGKLLPVITVKSENNRVIIRASNPVPAERADIIARQLNRINRLSEPELFEYYEDKISREQPDRVNTAGLGFILMKLKSGNKVNYRFISVNKYISTFELEISINRYIMRKLVIDQTSSSPKVILDPEKKIFKISGESRPPDVGEFYGEIMDWLKDYSHHLANTRDEKDPVVFSFDLDYFNSSSARYLLDFCKQIAQVQSKGKDVLVKWHYEDDDMDMLEVGREMSRMAKLPFEFISKEKG
jgi:hypothetical protein